MARLNHYKMVKTQDMVKVELVSYI